MNPRIHLKLAVLAAALTFLPCGCDHKSSDTAHEHPGHAEGGDDEGVAYEEGKGLEVPEEVKKAIGLEIVEVTEEKFSSSFSFQVQIYRESSDYSPVSNRVRPNQAYAVGLVDPEQLKHLQIETRLTLTKLEGHGAEISGRIIHLDDFAQNALGGTEALIEVPDPQNHFKLGTYFKATIQSKNTESLTTIPSEALLETALGHFVYVLNGKYLFRVAVKTGIGNERFIEIKEGLYPGDQVVKKPVQWLWLTELLAVKGGKGCTHGH